MGYLSFREGITSSGLPCKTMPQIGRPKDAEAVARGPLQAPCC